MALAGGLAGCGQSTPVRKPRWWIMQAGTADTVEASLTPRFAYSIEELSTVDFEDIPSREE